MKCRQCDHENPEDASFCERCGERLAVACAHCGEDNSPQANFCKRCGEAIEADRASLHGRPSAKEVGERVAGSPVDRLADILWAAPPELIQRMRAEAKRDEGVRKPVTILFSDIVGSTAIANRLDPEEWREVVSRAHSIVSQAVHSYEGTIAQLLGDGVLAFFGAPITHEDDPLRAALAALEIQESISRFSEELEGIVENLNVRIGIHTGTVVVGAVGDDLHMEYLAIGDCVNLAARLQAAADPAEIWISEATAKLIPPGVGIAGIGDLQLKGFDSPVRAFRVVGARRDAEMRPVPARAAGLLVGREPELEVLEGTIRQVAMGSGRIVFIMGEAGIGKSRLLVEARRRYGSDLRWLEAQALSFGRGLSFWSIRRMIEADLGLSRDEPKLRLKIALTKRLRDFSDADARDLYPYLGHLMGVKLNAGERGQVESLDGETLKHKVMESIGAYFAHLAGQRPTALVFEDLHWADASSLEAIERLLTESEIAPLLLVCLARPVREHESWALKLTAETNFGHRYVQVDLEELSEGASTRMIHALMDSAELAEDTRRAILEPTEGNPLYLEEVVRDLIEKKIFIASDSGYVPRAKMGQIEIPDSLQGVLLARVDRLQEEVRRTLQLASVIDRRFSYRLLRQIAAPEDEGTLREHLARLQRADLIRERPSGHDLEYMFKHALIHQVVYDTLLITQRQEHHARVAEALLELYSDREEEVWGFLAHHFEMAGRLEKALVYMVRAGDRARLEDSYEEALFQYQRAIEVCERIGDDQVAADTWMKLALTYQNDFDFARAHAAYERAFALRGRLRADQKGARGPTPSGGDQEFRMVEINWGFLSLDPAKSDTTNEAFVITQILAGVARLDADLNVVPHAARSWEVLESGSRYIIRLRDDVTWSDGEPVTAWDYEFAWKRNLRAREADFPANLLDPVMGARDYRLGRSGDEHSVGVRAVNSLTLEVQLESAVAYFPYLLTLPITFPQPKHAVMRHGDSWAEPGKMVSNGAYLLEEFVPREYALLRRNPAHFDPAPGNVEWARLQVAEGPGENVDRFLAGSIDYLNVLDMPEDQGLDAFRITRGVSLAAFYAILIPQAPLDDVRVRRALALALDKETISAQYNGRAAHGGIVPPGMPGHSPDISPPFDPAQARMLLAQAGYPGGHGFPKIHGTIVALSPEPLTRHWREVLGIEIEMEPLDWAADESPGLIHFMGWQADFPDPHNFLAQSHFHERLKPHGWHDPVFDHLLEQGARLQDRQARMRLYRQADRRLVSESAIIIPVAYGQNEREIFVQPWVQGIDISSNGQWYLEHVMIERGLD
jgi:ABC-type oligopeptide transport system substrate-binding subunit/class 3 adenylate cyclase